MECYLEQMIIAPHHSFSFHYTTHHINIGSVTDLLEEILRLLVQAQDLQTLLYIIHQTQI